MRSSTPYNNPVLPFQVQAAALAEMFQQGASSALRYHKALLLMEGLSLLLTEQDDILSVSKCMLLNRSVVCMRRRTRFGGEAWLCSFTPMMCISMFDPVYLPIPRVTVSVAFYVHAAPNVRCLLYTQPEMHTHK